MILRERRTLQLLTLFTCKQLYIFTFKHNIKEFQINFGANNV